MFSKLNIAYAILIALVLTSCAKTAVTIKTEPSGAKVYLFNEKGEQKDSVHSDTNYVVKNKEDYFDRDSETTSILMLAIKEGYKPQLSSTRLRLGEKNERSPIVRLDPLSTDISIETSPPGATVKFYDTRNREIPFLAKEFVSVRNPNLASRIEDHLRDVDHTTKAIKQNNLVTPFDQKYTTQTANNFFNRIAKIRIEKQGYNPEVHDISIRPDESNSFSYKLKPFNTSIKIISDIDGVEVEDVSNVSGASFGYLGKTPFIRKFTYDEVYKRDTFWNSGNIDLTLKSSRPGYENEYQNITVPIGEEMTVKITMRSQPKEISFQSDPQGSHVYVFRQKERDVFNPDTKKIEKKTLDHWKHLGVTPFTYYMDTSDPLKHTDQLKFSRPGYKDGFDLFKSGVNNYHLVLTPAGDIIQRQELKN
ncbi:hypothetical protein ACFOEK_16880 [Litoribrevibacter euphylliae]|uniref:Lipoprotein n=1 Tax=Litoribrevibacter euphylliae TaxID=1834034 RepID=A0ABV7HFN6_9GAMM